MKASSKFIAVTLLTAGTAVSAQQTYTVEYVVTPANVMIHVLADKDEKNRTCETINAASTIPELVQQVGGKLVGWSFLKSNSTFGYVTWITEKSGIHTTFIANYILKNCVLSETRRQQKSFDGSDRYARANAEYNKLIIESLGH